MCYFSVASKYEVSIFVAVINDDLDFQGPWEVVRKVFSADEHKNMTLDDKADLFFHDYSLGPLFVQQNYLSVLPKVPK